MIGASSSWLTGGRTVEVPCTVDLEHTEDSLHAYVELEGVEVRPGDEVLVHDAPTGFEVGRRVVHRRRATVRRAGLAERVWTRLVAHLELTELYEVGFSSRRTP